MAKIDMSDKELGERIRRMRHYRGYKEADMAERLGVSQRQYSRYESGETPPAPEKLAEVCEILEVSEEFLKNFDDRMVFNHCHQANAFSPGNVYYGADQLVVEELKARVEHQEEEIAFLREQLKASLAR
jgi:transcriptional regulator with XRE-family HTH domain